MDFSIIARNWLALNGDFKNFDFSLFTNTNIPRTMYEEFCYYAAGFSSGTALPSTVFKCSVDHLLGKSAPKDSVLFSAKDKGLLSCFKPEFPQATMQKAFSVLKSYVFNADSKLLSVSFATGEIMNQTIFQYVLMQHCNGKAVTVDDLMQLNLITNAYEKKTTQVYAIGSVIISPLSDDKFEEVLRSVYECVLAVCQPKFMDLIGELTLLSLNEGTGSAKKSVIKWYMLYLCIADIVGMTMNDLFHLFGYNIPDSMHSIENFGTLSFLGDQQKFQVLSASKTIETCAIGELPARVDDVDIFIDADTFNETYAPDVRRISF